MKLIRNTQIIISKMYLSKETKVLVQGASIYIIYSLHLALTAEDLFSMICIYQKKAVSLNRSFRQTTNSQKVTEKRYFCNLSCTP